MNESDIEAESKQRPEPDPLDGRGNAGASQDASRAPGAKTLTANLAVALAAGLLAWNLADSLRVTEVVQSVGKYGGAELSVPLATRNGAVAYAFLGAMLSLGFGVTAGLLAGRRSISGIVLVGLAGLALGACGGALSTYALHPLYYHHMEDADLTRSMLVHLGVWTAVGAAAGVAFGVGSGNRRVFPLSVAGGITGAALGTMLFDIGGAFLPVAHTERALAEAAGTRLAANLVLSVFVAIGIVVVASQQPRVPASKA